MDKPDLRYETFQEAVRLGIEQNFHLHEMVRRIAGSCPGRTLVVVERIEQGEYLKGLIPGASFLRGSTKLRDRKPAIDALLTGGRSVAIVMRHIITAGIDLKIHDLINAAGGDGAHNTVQLIGRGLRTADDKTKLRYHDFRFTNNDYLEEHSDWRMEVLGNEGHSVKLVS